MTIFTYWDGKMDAPLSFVGKTDVSQMTTTTIQF